MTGQRKYQVDRREKGLCQNCGQPAELRQDPRGRPKRHGPREVSSFCATCREKKKAQRAMRERPSTATCLVSEADYQEHFK